MALLARASRFASYVTANWHALGRRSQHAQRLERHARMALAEARLGTIGEHPFGRCHGIAETLEEGLKP